MITSFAAILAERRDRGAAVGAFTCYDTSTAVGVVLAAENAQAPVILLVAATSLRRSSGRFLIPALCTVAAAAEVPVCIQLDHAEDLDVMVAALGGGAGAVMADGSRLPFFQNVEITRRATELAGAAGASVEGELGHIEGGEDAAEAVRSGALTDPNHVEEFVSRTGVACLAVSIGNVHGTYAQPPQLDWRRLQAIVAAVDVPISLHGTSGLSDPDVRHAIELGIAKINVNTEIRRRQFDQFDRGLPELRRGYRMLDLVDASIDACSEAVSDKLRLLGPPL